jgi:glucosamine--fructose-6-phosphate aminotransferase (isomerizing)
LRKKGAALFCTGDNLPALPADHPDADAICLIQSFYSFAVALAASRGTDADRPRHLQKVTRTR